MRVLDHRGTIHGTVDTLEAEQFRITRRGMNGLEEHWMPFTAVQWVDHAVHLHQGMSETGASGGSDAAATRRGLRWPGRPLAWVVILGGLALVAVVASNAMHRDSGAPAQGTTAGVALPGGRSVAVAPGSVADDLQHFLASPQPVPRTFTLRTLDFAEGGSVIPSAATGELKTLARILAAYPKARVVLVGYADLPKNARVANDVQAAAELGRRRAAALAAALTAAGLPANAVEPVSGNDPAYLDSLTPATRKDDDDRHPDLIVTQK
jgi:outer membrane protein OmpA-like peptidoglycan-associated protein